MTSCSFGCFITIQLLQASTRLAPDNAIALHPGQRLGDPGEGMQTRRCFGLLLQGLPDAYNKHQELVNRGAKGIGFLSRK